MPATVARRAPRANKATGNRCGFRLDAPRINGYNHKHSLIRRGQENCRIFFQERHTAPQLFVGRKRWRQKHRGPVHDRTPRGERAEAIVGVAQFFLAHCDLNNMRIVERPGTAGGISLANIAAGTAMSLDRVKGALADLQSCGYVGGYQKREIRKGKYCGLVATRWFTRSFWQSIGMWRSLNKFRGRPDNAPSPKPAGRLVAQLAEQKSNAPRVDQDLENRIRAVEFELGRKHPEWTPDEVSAAARARFRR